MNEKEVKAVFLRGDASMQDDYMDFINYVFGFNGSSSDFYKLLPKLYKPEYNPAANSYITLEGERIKAVVGAFDTKLSVAETELKVRGIGNVAVHPFSRSKGYMKTLMNMAVEDMIKDGVDLSALGGRRQRYNYFSYEKGGVSYSFSLNSDNMRHVFGNERKKKFDVRRVNAGDAVLKDIAALSDSRAYHAIREPEKLYDILTSWSSYPMAAFDGERFVGYAVVSKDRVSEMLLVNNAEFMDMATSLYDTVKQGTLNFTLPEFEREYITEISKVCEGFSISANELYSIFNYRRVCNAFMKLHTTYAKLPDGELVLRIEGRAKTENLLFSVKNGVPSVKDTDREPFTTLSHLEAENMLFACVYPQRYELPDFARLWFPLPLWLYHSDVV